MFESVVMEYLDKTKGKDWSILGILEFARSNSNPKLSVATTDDFKDDLYAILQSYAEKCNVHVYRNKATKILSRFNSLFSTAEVKQFIKDLEYHEEARINVTFTYTATVLKARFTKFETNIYDRYRLIKNLLGSARKSKAY